MSDDDPRPLCVGKWELFDSIDLADHREAAALCRECPLRAWCSQQLRWTARTASARTAASRDVGPVGTWAGQLVGTSQADRTAAEEQSYSTREVHEAYRRYRRGDRTEWVLTGTRIYWRRKARGLAS